MIDKIKKLKSKRDAMVERLGRLNSEKKESLARVLAAEDQGKNSDELRNTLNDFKSEIEIAEAAIGRIDGKIKSQISDLVKSQLKSYQKEKIQFLEEIKKTLFDSGEPLGRIMTTLEGMGSDGFNVAKEISLVLKRNQHICAPLIEGRAKFINEHNAVPPLVAKRSYFSRMDQLKNDPGEMGRIVEKYFHRCLKDSYGSLEGRS